MKNVIFITCWIFFAFTQTIKAQEESTTYTDTVIVYLEGRNQVHITGMRLEEIHEYHKADSLKTLFVADVTKAFEKGVVTSENKNVHYLVSGANQRRLKSSVDPYTEDVFDLEKEKKRMELDLPSYRYTIYDIQNGMEIGIYLEDTTKLALLNNHNLDLAIKKVSEADDLKNISRMNVRKENGLYVATGKRPKPTDQLELTYAYGAMLLGNSLSPTLGATLGVNLNDKYGTPATRLGITYSNFALVNYADAKFTNLRVGQKYSAFAMFNLSSDPKNQYWFGVEAGYVGMYKKATPFKDAVHVGLMTNYKGVTISAGALFPVNDRKNALPMLTLKLPF